MAQGCRSRNSRVANSRSTNQENKWWNESLPEPGLNVGKDALLQHQTHTLNTYFYPKITIKPSRKANHLILGSEPNPKP